MQLTKFEFVYTSLKHPVYVYNNFQWFIRLTTCKHLKKITKSMTFCSFTRIGFFSIKLKVKFIDQ